MILLESLIAKVVTKEALYVPRYIIHENGAHDIHVTDGVLLESRRQDSCDFVHGRNSKALYVIFSVFLCAYIHTILCKGDIETRKNVHTYTLGPGVINQQVGNAWAPSGAIISLSMSGDLNVFDDRSSDKPSRILSVS